MNRLLRSKWLLRLSRWLFGIVFILSGLIKANDPVGFSIKLQEYAHSFGFDSFDSAMLVAAVALGLLEFYLGVAILLPFHTIALSYVALILMSGMTLLTFYLAIANPISDCGCFGDAFILTNWETFGKNLILMAAIILIFIRRRELRPIYHRSVEFIPRILIVLLFIGITHFCINRLPIINFRPYHIGANLIALTQTPPDAPAPQFESTFIYKKGAEEKEFTLEKAPYNDSTWHYVRTHQRVITLGYEPPIKDFHIFNAAGEDKTAEILNDSIPTLLIVATNLSSADESRISDITHLYDYSLDNDLTIYGLTSSSDEDIDEWRSITGAEYPILKADRTTLQTLMRSDLGFVLLKKGKIIGIWSSTSFPKTARFVEQLESNTDQFDNRKNRYIFFSAIGLALIFILFIIFVLQKGIEALVWRLSFLQNTRRLMDKLNPEEILEHSIPNPLIENQMRKNIVAGNWKMNKNFQEGVEFAKSLNTALSGMTPNCDVVIGTPFIHLATVASAIDTQKIGVAAQNCADKKSGAYTGEISAEMVASTGAAYVILGHSERRAYYGETAEILKEKVLLTLANGLTPIFCIGEVLEERESGKHFDVVKSQIEASLFNLSVEEFSKIIIAYEPVWAIGTGKTASSDQAQEMHAFIRQILVDKYGKEAANNCSILYGGSCNATNAKELFANPDVDGGLIGGACLQVDTFMAIINAV